MEPPIPSRRQFMVALGNLTSVGWLTLNWPQIAAAADMAENAHAGHAMHGAGDAAPPHAALTALTPAEAAEIDAIANQIVPGGKTPGARDARVVYFIDNAVGSFFAEQLPAIRQGLAKFQAGFVARFPAEKTFSAAPEPLQIAWLHESDKTPFFTAVRRLTVLGLIALPKYGGNKENLGWNLLGVVDNHYWEPPFGFYDKDYAGFVPYPGTKPYTA